MQLLGSGFVFTTAVSITWRGRCDARTLQKLRKLLEADKPFLINSILIVGDTGLLFLTRSPAPRTPGEVVTGSITTGTEATLTIHLHPGAWVALQAHFHNESQGTIRRLVVVFVSLAAYQVWVNCTAISMSLGPIQD